MTKKETGELKPATATLAEIKPDEKKSAAKKTAAKPAAEKKPRAKTAPAKAKEDATAVKKDTEKAVAKPIGEKTTVKKPAAKKAAVKKPPVKKAVKPEPVLIEEIVAAPIETVPPVETAAPIETIVAIDDMQEESLLDSAPVTAEQPDATVNPQENPEEVVIDMPIVDTPNFDFQSTDTPKKKILLVGSECTPFAKTGGLADVLGTLPQELVKLGLDARVLLPFHRVIKDRYRMETEHIADFYIHLGWRTKFVGIEKLVKDSVTYYFIDNEDYFGKAIYLGGEPEGEQYAFFCRAAIEALYRIDFIPDVMHLNDWQTGMIPLLLRTQYRYTPLENIKTVFTIHNMMYQGMYGFDFVQDLLGVDTHYYTPEFMEANGCANYMKAGLVFCDRINTVSPTYAKELLDPYYSYGLEGILNARAHETVGILNGIDTEEEYNPEKDIHIPCHFSISDRSGKEKNKKDLMEKLGMEYHEGRPLIGLVSRLTSQKGFDLIMSVFHEIMGQHCSIVLLGTGDKAYQDFFRKMEYDYKGKVCAYIGYDNNLAHQIYAASDLFLMPSKFEPCGISQMIALRYGTLPVVRETGGLKDTVIPFNEFTGEGNGFTFTNYNAYDMLEVIKYALSCVTDEEKRNTLIENAMHCDNSFHLSAEKYRDLYLSLL